MSLHAKVFPIKFSPDQILTLSNIASLTESLVPRISKAAHCDDLVKQLKIDQQLKDFNLMLQTAYNCKTLYGSYAMQSLILKLSYLYELTRIEAAQSDYVGLIQLQNTIDRIKSIYTICFSDYLEV